MENDIKHQKILKEKSPELSHHFSEEKPKENDDDSPVLEKKESFQGKINEMHDKNEKFDRNSEEKIEKYEEKYEEKPEIQEKVIKSSLIRENSKENLLKSQKNSDRNLDKNLIFRSELIEKNGSNPYNFRSVINKKEVLKPTFQKLFEIEENYKISAKKPEITKILPRNDDKLSQLMNIKEMDRFSENSEKNLEIFDYSDFKKENVILKDENHDLKEKLRNLLNNQQETDHFLSILKQENEVLHREKLKEFNENRVENHEEFLENLQRNNETLRIENQALNEYIQQQQHENELLKQNIEKKSIIFNKNTDDFGTLEMLKKENEALREYIMENKLKESPEKGENHEEIDLLNRVMKENEDLKVHILEMQRNNAVFPDKKVNLLDNNAFNDKKGNLLDSLRNSAISRENFEFEEPKIQQNMQGTSSFKTKFMMNSSNNDIVNVPKHKNPHFVHNSNDFPEETKEKPKEKSSGNFRDKSNENSNVSPHKKIFEKPPVSNTEELKKSMDVGSDKKKRSNEASHNQSMDESQHQRLSNYLKRSGKFSRNESQKSAHTEQNRSFEENNEKIVASFNQIKGVIKSSMPYEGPRNFEENFDTNSILSKEKLEIIKGKLEEN